MRIAETGQERHWSWMAGLRRLTAPMVAPTRNVLSSPVIVAGFIARTTFQGLVEFAIELPFSCEFPPLLWRERAAFLSAQAFAFTLLPSFSLRAAFFPACLALTLRLLVRSHVRLRLRARSVFRLLLLHSLSFWPPGRKLSSSSDPDIGMGFRLACRPGLRLVGCAVLTFLLFAL
jgi:hypothetical protein